MSDQVCLNPIQFVSSIIPSHTNKTTNNVVSHFHLHHCTHVSFPFLQFISENTKHHLHTQCQREASPNAEIKKVNIELQVQGWYKLYEQPTRGCQMLTMEEEYLVSPKFTSNFKLPLFLSAYKVTCGSCVEEELNKLLLPPALAQYLRPFILQSVLGLAQQSYSEFKVVFDVKVIKIDLANYHECDSYRRSGLV